MHNYKHFFQFKFLFMELGRAIPSSVTQQANMNKLVEMYKIWEADIPKGHVV